MQENVFPVFIKIRNTLTDLFSKIKNTDLEDTIRNKWNDISQVSKKSFFLMFLITNVVFLFYTVHFLWGNEDMMWLLTPLSINSEQMSCGRFASTLFQQIFGGNILPTINSLVSFGGFSLGMICLAKYWKIPQTTFCYSLFGIFTILSPYTCSWLWYQKQLTLLSTSLLVTSALFLSLEKSYIASFSAILLFFICFGIYPPIILMISVILLSRMLMDTVLENKNIKTLFQTYFRTFVNIFISLLIFLLVIYFIKKSGKLIETAYNAVSLNNVAFPDLAQIKVTLAAMKQRFFLADPFMSTPYKIICALPVIYVFYTVFRTRRKQLIRGILLLFLVIISTSIVNLTSRTDLKNAPRIDFFSVPYLYACFMAFCLRGEKTAKSFAILVMSVAIWMGAISDFNFQKTFYLGKNAEQQVLADIINKIKSHPNFNPDKKYTLVSTQPLSLRKNFYTSNAFDLDEYTFLRASTINVIPGYSYLTDPEIQMERNYNYYHYFELPDEYSITETEPFPFTLQELSQISFYFFALAEPYPRRNSVYVDENFIYVVYSKEGLTKARELINHLHQKNGM